MVWRFLFLRQLIEDHHIRFDERVVLAEDELFCAEYALHAQSLALVSEARYIYVRHPRGAINRLINRCDFSYLTIGLLARRDIGIRAGDEDGLLERFWLASLVLPVFGTMYRCGVLGQSFLSAYKSCRSYCSFPEVKRALCGFPLCVKRFSRSAMVLMMRFGMRPALFTALYCFGRLRGMVSSAKESEA